MQAGIKVNWKVVEQITKLSLDLDDLIMENNPNNKPKIEALEYQISELQKQRYIPNASNI